MSDYFDPAVRIPTLLFLYACIRHAMDEHPEEVARFDGENRQWSTAPLSGAAGSLDDQPLHPTKNHIVTLGTFAITYIISNVALRAAGSVGSRAALSRFCSPGCHLICCMQQIARNYHELLWKPDRGKPLRGRALLS